ncbi:hypothetical protein AVEN_264811-1 [Araneus ventricosus]|uniref:Uncharacterized protein n=1 Tax=Araneus ventricosus TaxID=182803 RepID=A0A4Y2E0F0_ARAVE|nr:hypothetical protein AVEN_264811-1 [Araneus ventricosus]
MGNCRRRNLDTFLPRLKRRARSTRRQPGNVLSGWEPPSGPQYAEKLILLERRSSCRLYKWREGESGKPMFETTPLTIASQTRLSKGNSKSKI